MAIPRKHYSTYDVTVPRGLNMARGAMWVYCENGDPTKAVMYRGYSVQGNASKDICLRLSKPYPECELVFIDNVYTPWED